MLYRACLKFENRGKNDKAQFFNYLEDAFNVVAICFLIFFVLVFLKRRRAKNARVRKAVQAIEKAEKLVAKGEDAAARYLKFYAQDLKNPPENSREQTYKKLTSASNFTKIF